MSDTPNGLILAGCGAHRDDPSASCYKIRRLDGTALTAAEVWVELTAAQAEIAELRAAFGRQRDNYTQLYEAVLGDGTVVQCDPVAVAKELRAKCERLLDAHNAISGTTMSHVANYEHGMERCRTIARTAIAEYNEPSQPRRRP